VCAVGEDTPDVGVYSVTLCGRRFVVGAGHDMHVVALNSVDAQEPVLVA
jgi:hypothetical protein